MARLLFSIIVLALVNLTWLGLAQASGFFVARFGGEHGHATTDNLTSMYYNPAGLSLGTGTRLYLDGNFAWRHFSYERPAETIDHILDEGEQAPGTPERAIAANSGTGKLENYLASPFIGVASDFGIPGLGVGLSLYAPFGGSSSFDKVNEVEGFPGSVDGPQRWWAIEGTIKSIYITGTVAYYVPQLRLAFGLSLNMVKSTVHTARARNADGKDHLAANDDGDLLEGRAMINVEGTEPSLGVGVIWEPIVDQLFLGVSFQTAPNFGESKLTGKAKLVLGYTDPTNPDVTFYQRMPEVIQFGARWLEKDHYEVRFHGNYILWSALKEQCALDDASPETCDGNPLFMAPRFWSDGYALRLGGSYWVTPGVELLGGGGYDSNAAPDKTVEPALYDTDKFTASLGAKMSIIKDSLALAMTYTQVFYMERDIEPRGRVEVPGNPTQEHTDIDQFGFRQGQRQPDSSGVYNQSIGVLNVNVEYTF